MAVNMSSPAVSDPWTTNHIASPSTPDRRKHRKTWHAASPHKVNSPDSATPCLKVTHFTKKVIVCFDVVKVGKTKRKTLKLINPHDYPQMVELERICPKKGFYLEEKAWDIQPNETLTIPIFWTPKDDGNYRDLITFLCEGAFRLQVILLGTAEEAKRVSCRRSTFLVKRQSTSKPLRPSNTSNLRVKRQSTQASSNGAGKENKVLRKPTTKTEKYVVDRRTGSRRSTPLAAKTNGNETGKICRGDKGRSLTRIDIQSQENVGCFDERTTSQVLEELSGATEPVKNVLIENVARETLLVCEGMSPLLKSKKFDRNVNGTNPRCGSPSNKNVSKILKGTEIKVHQSERLSGDGIKEFSKRTLFTDPEDHSEVEREMLKSPESDKDAKRHDSSDLTDDSLETVNVVTDAPNANDDDVGIVEDTAFDTNNDSTHLNSVDDKACSEQAVVDDIPENTASSTITDSDDIVGTSNDFTSTMKAVDVDIIVTNTALSLGCDSDNVGESTDVVDDATINVEDTADFSERKTEEKDSKEGEMEMVGDVEKSLTEDSENDSCNRKTTDTKDRDGRQEDKNEELEENGDEHDINVEGHKISRLVDNRSVGDEDSDKMGEKFVEEEKEEDRETGEKKYEKGEDDEENVTGSEVILVSEGSMVEQDDTEGDGGAFPGESRDDVAAVEGSDGGGSGVDAHRGERLPFGVVEEKPAVDVGLEENGLPNIKEAAEKPAIGDVIDDVTDDVTKVEKKVEKKGLVFIPLDDDIPPGQTGVNHSKRSKRVVEDVGMGEDKGTKKQRLADKQSSSERNDTSRGRKSSLSLNRIVALRRASATNSSVSQAPRTKPKVKRTMKGVPMAKLNLVKPARTALPRHPMPFAAKNMFYDERWVDKQERGFVQWLNYVLTPEDVGNRNPSVKGTKIEASMLAVSSSSTSIRRAPTKEVLSLRAYTARRRLNQLRRASCLLFQSEPVVWVIQKLEALVENRGLSVRTDRKIHADLGMKQNILMMILSYNPLWLRIGLETTYGELLPVEDNSDIVGLSRFIVTRLLGNPDIAASYAHPTVPALFGPGYEEALAKFTLKKFLLLVFFLDKAKLTRLIDHDPCLFCKDAQYKSSRDLLLEFSRLYLKGEGDITRHLNYIGFSVTHTQKALDEYDFAVVNLAKDLRDGVRLVRVTELLTKNWLLSHDLRCPAISRLQKIHNVQVALSALSQCTDLSGCGVDAKSIVEGHREKTLQLLWSIIFSFKVETMLDEAQLKEETTFLWNNLKLKRKLDAVKILSSYKSAGHGQEVTNVYFKSGKLSLLLKWCQAVCAYYSVQVENFTVSFCDGRVLCYLVHHYHPELLPLSSINNTTTQTENQKDESSNENKNESFDGTWTRSFSPTTGKESSLDQLMKNEQQNFKVLYQAIQSLGGVPFMIKSMDMSGTIPDEKVVITYTSYLCARLLDLCHETRAVRTIQMAWRAYQLRKQTEHLKKLNKAATVIQQKIRLHLRKRFLKRREAAVICLQTAVRGWMARRKIQTLKRKERQRQEDAAAVILQSHYRRLKAQRLYANQLKVIIKLQAMIRGKRIRQDVMKMKKAVLLIEDRYTAHKQRNDMRQKYKETREAVIVLQTFCRGLKARRLYREMKAAQKIQARWKGFIMKQRYESIRGASVVIQSAWRMHVEKKRYTGMKQAARQIQDWYRAIQLRNRDRNLYLMKCDALRKIQAFCRGLMARRMYTRQRNSCILIQATFRSYLARKRYRQMRYLTIKLQRRHRANVQAREECQKYRDLKDATNVILKFTRGWLVRKQMKKERQAACLIQAHVKGFIRRKQYNITRQACVMLQRNIRCYQQRCQYLALKRSVLLIQSVYRGQLARRRIKVLRSAIKIQATFRMYKARCQFQAEVAAIVSCQAAVRCYIMHRRYVKTRSATKVIQKHVRGWLETRKTRDEYCVMKSSCITIQSAFKGYVARRQYLKTRQDVVTCQAVMRTFIIRRRYIRLLAATRVIQKHFRGWLEARKTRDEYCVVKSSCITIQSAFKGYVTRRQYLKTRQDIVTCQAVIRTFIIRRRYVRLLAAAGVIQKHFRGWLKMKIRRHEYSVMKSSCTTIQAVFRGYMARRQYLQARRNIILCQSLVRSFLEKRRYQKQRNAALILQRRYRALQSGRASRASYCQQRQACIVLQTSVRMYLCRKRYLALKSAAVLVQSCRRMVVVRERYQVTLAACRTIQKRWREVLVARQQRKSYLQVKHAALVLQSYYRGLCARRHVKYIRSVVLCQSAVRRFILRQNYLKQRNAAIQIQAFLKGQITRHRYMQKRAAAMVIQEWWRSTLLCRQDYLMYHVQRGAVITLQSAVRGWFVRKELKKAVEAAVIIQSMYRRHKAMKNYSKTHNAVLTLQKFTRAYIKGRTTRAQYLMKRESAVSIQSWWRMKQRRREYRRMKDAVITLQTWMRMVLQYRQYQYEKGVVIVIQKRWRAKRQADEEKRQYLQMKKAAITLQAWARGVAVRIRVQTWHESATKIEAYWRGFRERREYKDKRLAAVKIQRRFKAFQLMRKQKVEYEKLRRATVTVQAMYRGLQGRRLVERHRAARLIQATYRMYQAQVEYHKLKSAVVLLQAMFRCVKQRKEYLKMKWAAEVLQKHWRSANYGRMEVEKYRRTRQAVITVQSTVRGWIARRQFVEVKKSTVIIQSVYRMYRAVRSFQNIRDLVVKIQRQWRTKKLGEEERRRYLGMKRAAITLQAWSRGLAVRKEVQSWQENATKIQAFWRGFRERRSYLVQRLAAVKIQRQFRAHQCMRREQMKYEALRRAVITTQAMYRGMQGRRLACHHRAARLIQATYRMHQTRKQYQRCKTAAVLLQTTYRGYKCRTTYQKTLRAVLVLQQHFRACLKGMHDRAQLQAEHNAAVVIQSHCRRFACRNNFLQQRKAAITLQSNFRRHRQKKQYREMRLAAGKIQRYWRATVMMREEVLQYKKERDAVIMMQASVRCFLIRQKFLKMRKAAISIQTAWRCIHARRTYVHQRKAATIIQRRFRAQRMGMDCRVAFLTRKASAITIQTTFRRYISQKQFIQKKAAAVVIQSWVRGQQCLKKFQKERTAAMVVQRWYRNVLLTRRIKREFEVMSMATLRIQSIWRGQRDRKRVTQLRWQMAVAKERLDALLKIQTWARSRLERLRFVRLREATLLAQGIYKKRHQKRVEAVIILQSFCRTWLAKRRLNQMQSAALKLQSIWRGRKVRVSMKSKKIARARDRCMKACKAATEEKKLCNRTTSGLHFLLTYKHLHQVVEAVCSLEVATRLSARCCERLVAGQAVPVLFRLIKNCNRSLPCMEVIKYVVATLVNLAKYPPTAPSVLEAPDAVTSILDLMMIYRETNPVIFTKATMLLTVLAQEESLQKILLGSPKINDKLRSLLNLQERKLKLKTRQMIAKSKSQGMNVASSQLMTPSKRKRLARSFQPDWVLGRFKRQDLEDPIEALKCLMGTLSMKF